MRLEKNERKFKDKETIKMVSRNIAFYRKHHRNPKYFNKQLTQLALAEEILVSRSLISSIESEAFFVEFSLPVVNRCSKVCNIPLHWYFLPEPPKEFYQNKD